MQLTTPENTISYHMHMHMHRFQFSWGHFNSQEKLKIMLMQNFGVTNKERYGMLWHFLEWSINELVSVMVFHLNFCPTLVFSLLAD